MSNVKFLDASLSNLSSIDLNKNEMRVNLRGLSMNLECDYYIKMGVVHTHGHATIGLLDASVSKFFSNESCDALTIFSQILKQKKKDFFSQRNVLNY